MNTKDKQSPIVLDNTPFFLIGCVRSGTTLLRDLLRNHPRLECPEETHFFRWADPYGSDRYRRNYKGSKLFKRHMALDGVDSFSFYYTLDQSLNRREMSDHYGKIFLKAQGNEDGRWFDKTPQNVYGALLLNGYYPTSKFIHIHRNPLNVVASLMEGKVMPVHSFHAAINYWMESMFILNQFKTIAAGRVLEISYERLCEKPEIVLKEIFSFLDEDDSLYPYSSRMAHPEKNKYKKKLKKEQIQLTQDLTQPFFTQYGYE